MTRWAALSLAILSRAEENVINVNTELDPAEAREAAAQRNMDEFKRADTNADGILSEPELSAAFNLVQTHDLSEDERREFFDKMDEDLNGKVSANEYADPMRSFTVLLRKQFEHLDISNDGALDEHELQIGMASEKMAICDADADDQVVLTEFIEGSLRTLFATDFVQGDPTEIGVDAEGQPLPTVRKVPAPEGLRYAAAIVARDAHIYDPFVKYQDMKRQQNDLRSVMGEMQQVMSEMGANGADSGEAASAFPGMEGLDLPEGMDLSMLMGAFGGDVNPEKSAETLESVLNSFDNEQVAEDAQRLFGRPSIREMMGKPSARVEL